MAVREEAGEAAEAVDGNRAQTLKPALACCDPLHAKRISARPFHLVLRLAIRTDRGFFHLLAQPRRSNDPHAAYTPAASQNLLHGASSHKLRGWSGWGWSLKLLSATVAQTLLSVLSFTYSSVSRGFGGGVQSVLRHLMRSTRQRFNLHPVKMVQRHETAPHRIRLLYSFDDISFR